MKRWLLVVAGLVAGGAAVWSVCSLTVPSPPPDFAAVRAGYVPSEAYLLDRHGEVLQVLREDYTTRRLPWVSLEQVSPALIAAILQAEDRRFRAHSGVDFLALLGAGGQDLHGGTERGASTISMQVAALLDPGLAPRKRRRTVLQKIRQMRAAWRLEAAWSKDQILEGYLNLVGFRGELQGVNTAAHALLGKVPSGLTQDESWLLAALLPAPAASSASVVQRACMLKHSLEPGAPCLALERLAYAALDRNGAIAPEADLAPQLARRLLRRPGERVRTTLDAGIQRLAAAALQQQLLGLGGNNVRDAAALVVDNASGEVLAYVDAAPLDARAALVDGVRAPRQAGSTLKPFLYGLALEKRYLTAASLLDDSPVRLQTGGGLYIPQDYDRDYHGLVSVRSALAGSLNVPAVRTLVLVSPDAFLERLHALGYASISEPADYYGFSLALGSAEVTLLEQVNAFRTLANGGRSSPLRLDPAAEPGPMQRVMSAEASFIVGDILSDRGGRALTFGLDNALTTPFWTAVKTGTSKFMRDNWCIGYSRQYTVGVWVGNFDGEPMHDVSGVAGAAPAWLEIMQRLHEAAHADPADASPAIPPGLAAAQVRFAHDIEPSRHEWFIKGTEVSDVEAAPARDLKPHLDLPAAGTIIALDPDIPGDRQQVLFRAVPRKAALRYELDSGVLASADHEYFWSPLPGRHTLRLIDANGVALDQLSFSVRRAR